MGLRSRRVDSHCRAMRAKGVLQAGSFKDLFYMKEKGVLWCPVFKAASTAWIDNFLRLSGNADKVSESVFHHLREYLNK